MNVALAKNNKIDNIIVVDTVEWAQEYLPQYDEFIDNDVAKLGIGWEKVDGVWQAPAQPVPPVVYKSILTPYEFLMRFTKEEWFCVEDKSATDRDVRYFMTMYNKAQEINLDEQSTIDGVGYLEVIGCLSEGRAAEILTKYPI